MSVVSIDRILSIEFSFSDRELIAFVTGILTIAVVLEMAGLNVGAFRSIPAVIALSVFPGYLTVEICRMSVGTRSKKLLYAVGLSLIILMTYGFVLNQTLRFLGVEAIFTEQRILIAVLALIGGLLAVDKWRNQSRTFTVASVQYFWHPWPLALLTLPFLSVLGARTVTRFGENIPILLVLTILAVVVLIGYLDKMPRRYFPLAVYVIALSILLHNSVLNHALAWDAGRELRLASVVLENNIWDPAVGAQGRFMKNAMLRIVILHPIYTLVSGVELLWEFKTIHPIIYAFAPVALFQSYQSVVGERDALLSVLLAVSYFPFFTVTSVNTRTAGSILFLSLFTLSVVDSNISRLTQRFLGACFLFGIIVSHYGVAFITMLALPIALIGGIILFDGINIAGRKRVNLLTVAFFFSILLTWYIFIVYLGIAFNDLANESFSLLSDVQRDLSGAESDPVVSQESSKTTQYTTREYTSNTITWLQDYYLLIGGLAGAAIGVVGLKKLWYRVTRWSEECIQQQVIAESEYLFIAAGHLAVFGITFVGVDRLNTARTLLPALVLFAPFVIWIPVAGSKKLANQIDMKQIHSVGRVIAVIIVIGFFSLNVGIVGSLSEEYHPNIMIDKDRVIDDGSLAEKDYFWAMHYGTVFDPQSGKFVATAPGNNSAYHKYDTRKIISGMYNCTDVSRQPVTPQGSCDAGPSEPVKNMHKVYANNGSVVYYNQTYMINA